MNYFIELLIFIIKILIIVGCIFIFKSKSQCKTDNIIKIKNLNYEYKKNNLILLKNIFSKSEIKNKIKDFKKNKNTQKNILFVLDFIGDIEATQVDILRSQIDFILQTKNLFYKIKVLLKLESPGGMVPSYGLASSQLMRLKNHGIELIISIDKIAASGGYMMACIATKIIAAPFAIIGSIGVVCQFPNFNKLLNKYGIEFEELIAGNNKRSLTIFGKNTEEKRLMMQTELNEIHTLFINFVSSHRKNIDINKISNGNHWFAQATIDLNLQLIDEILTSDEYLEKYYLNKEYEIYSLYNHQKIKNKNIFQSILKNIFYYK
jgi:serine protease SohB